MTDYQKWIERINNLINIQSIIGLDTISAAFTRRELIELKLMIETIKELTERENSK